MMTGTISNFNSSTTAEWLILLNQTPPFFPPKRAKNRHQFFTLKKLTPLSFLLYFYVVIFPMPTQNCKKSINSNGFPRFFFQMGRNGSKSACPKNFFPPHKSPKPPKTRQPATISHSVSNFTIFFSISRIFLNNFTKFFRVMNWRRLKNVRKN